MRLIVLLALLFLATPHANADERTSKLDCITFPIDRLALEQRGLALYEDKCLPELRKKVTQEGHPLSDHFYRLALATIVAHYSAPYGDGRGIGFEEVLHNPTLNCGNYGALVVYLSHDSDVDFVGFDGGAVGNHQQLFATVDGRNVLLDPTVGMIAFVGFDDLLSGRRAKAIFSFFSGDPTIRKFNAKVLEAVETGQYKPSDLLYFYPDFNAFVHPDKIWPFITPGGVSFRARTRS
jgi:hypothetical protein